MKMRKHDGSPIIIDDIYTEYIDKKNNENFKERYVDNRGWYRASSAGFCSRKMYYESVMKVDETNPPNSESKMKMRLGTIFHDELQGALTEKFPSIYNIEDNNNIEVNSNSLEVSKSIDTKEKDRYSKEKEKWTVDVEGNIEIEDINVRGHYDVVFKKDKVYLYDIKTIGAYPWSTRFGTKNKKPQSRAYPLQVGTYGLGVEEKFGRIDGMYLYFYNKDTSKTRTEEVPMMWKSKAYMYWNSINEEHAKGLPPIELGQSPEKTWACNYCPFRDVCNPDAYINEMKSKKMWF
jgi:CRISPR/Cas system-associated exonuclease Cas4 (RecB family)